MSSRQEQRQPNIPKGSYPGKEAVKPQGVLEVPSSCPAQAKATTGKDRSNLMEEVLERSRMFAALKRVKDNKGAPGIDGMTVYELPAYLQEHWPSSREQLLAGAYQPQPVRRVEIPKTGGSKRMLGIPTALDRLIQQALQDRLTLIFDPGFSENSYGFRPGRSAHQAVQKAQEHLQAGYRYVVDIDLETFFDRINHDVLMSRIARKVQDKRVLKLIRAYLKAGVMVHGCAIRSEDGASQGGPLSPLLANVLLDDLDKELEARGHRFVRYADDCNLYVKSWRAGHRVMESVKEYLEGRLKLRVNREKSAVDRPWKRKFLGFTFSAEKNTHIRLAPKTIQRLKDKIRELTQRSRSMSMEARVAKLNQYLRGWVGYFRLAQMKTRMEELDEWLRRRLRMCLLKQWKKPRTKRRNLVALGIPEQGAMLISSSRKGCWRLAKTPQLHKALDLAYWQKQGLMGLVELYRKHCYAT